jgi:succinate dehydrogenase / fumarate reductase flavoprotein subunit
MNDHVGIIREEAELREGLKKLLKLKEKVPHVRAEGTRVYNPGWHQALALPSMFTVSEAITRAAIERKESRGGHSRSDFPSYDKELAKLNFIISQGKDGSMGLRREPLPQMPAELQELFKGD